MHTALTGLPVLDAADLKAKATAWEPLMAGPGNDRVVVEWWVGKGPNCYVYPAAKRAAGISLTTAANAKQSDERWADFLEYEFVPQVAKALEEAGFRAQIICADLRPVQIQRERRRALEAAALAKTGAAAGHH